MVCNVIYPSFAQPRRHPPMTLAGLHHSPGCIMRNARPKGIPRDFRSTYRTPVCPERDVTLYYKQGAAVAAVPHICLHEAPPGFGKPHQYPVHAASGPLNSHRTFVGLGGSDPSGGASVRLPQACIGNVRRSCRWACFAQSRATRQNGATNQQRGTTSARGPRHRTDSGTARTAVQVARCWRRDVRLALRSPPVDRHGKARTSTRGPKPMFRVGPWRPERFTTGGRRPAKPCGSYDRNRWSRYRRSRCMTRGRECRTRTSSRQSMDRSPSRRGC